MIRTYTSVWPGIFFNRNNLSVAKTFIQVCVVYSNCNWQSTYCTCSSLHVSDWEKLELSQNDSISIIFFFFFF